MRKSHEEASGLFIPQAELQIAVPPIFTVFPLSHKSLTNLEIETSLLCDKDRKKKALTPAKKKEENKKKKAAEAVSQCLPAALRLCKEAQATAALQQHPKAGRAPPGPAGRLMSSRLDGAAWHRQEHRHSRGQCSSVLLGTGQDLTLQLKAAFSTD